MHHQFVFLSFLTPRHSGFSGLLLQILDWGLGPIDEVGENAEIGKK